MKKIINFRKGTVADVESDDLLEDATKLHVLSYDLFKGKSGSISGEDAPRLKKFLQYHIHKKIPLVGHNFILFDIPLLEKMLDMDLSGLMVIDTLWVSWILNQNTREKHGLDSFFEDYGIKKPPITDWVGLSYSEYKNRCDGDVRINQALWSDFVNRLDELAVIALAEIRCGNVDGVRLSDQEVQYIDRFKDKNVTKDDYICWFLEVIMFKADCVRKQYQARIKVCIETVNKEMGVLGGLLQESRDTLEKVMPDRPIYRKKTFPKKPRLKSSKLSSTGLAWKQDIANYKNKVKDKWGNRLTTPTVDSKVIKVISGYNPPNINSPLQVKALLQYHKWVPLNFKFVYDKKKMKAWEDAGSDFNTRPKPRAVPQISIDGREGKELCPSVVNLSEDIPEIMAYANYTTIKHRFDTLNGFKKNMSDDGYLRALVGGLTNTMRMKHKELVNLPGVKKPYAKAIRSSLICESDEILLGSDLSSLEDRVKAHFALPIDPDYVNTVNSPGYDPHIEMCHIAELITLEQFNDFMQVALKQVDFDNGDCTEDELNKFTEKFDLVHSKAQRPKGKTTNYAAVYGAGAKTIARAAGISIEEAEKLHKAYWAIHNYVKVIADSQCVIKDSRGEKWLINPINGLPYSLRKEKDKFSTLIQGSGAFFFDMWLDNILNGMYDELQLSTLCGQFHDEYITRLKDEPEIREAMRVITKDAIKKVNSDFMLRRDLDCDVQFGKNYGSIH